MRFRCLRLGLIVFACAFCFRISGDEPKIDATKLFPADVGAQWDYVVEANGKPNGKISNRIAKLETIDDKKLIRQESSLQGKVAASEHLSVEEGGLYRHRMNGTEVVPPVCIIKFPVKADDTWQIKSKIGEETLTGDCVAGLEEVVVPAGTFQTVRVKTQAKAGNLDLDSTVWYAEKYGMVQQTISINGQEFTLKLDKFTAGKK
jgi:hypothetical protein